MIVAYGEDGVPKTCRCFIMVHMVSFLTATHCLRLDHSKGSPRPPPSCAPAHQVRERTNMLSSGQLCNGAPYQPPQCSACQLHGDDAPRLFIPSRGDGLGERSMSLLWYMAWAASNGFNFGGIVMYPRHSCRKPHGVDTDAAISSLLGQDVNSLFVKVPPKMGFNFSSWGGFAAKASWLRTCRNVNVGLRTPEWKTPQDPLTGWRSPPPVTAEFISALRHGAAQFLRRPLQYRPGVLNVALHVRRDDDVTKFHPARWRYVPDKWYYELVEKMKETYEGPMDVHVFSSTGLLNKVSHLDGFTSRGMIVHLDGDVLDDWSHMAHADILVMAPSSFSFIPGLFNQKCVLDSHWTRNWTQQFLHFIPVTPTSAYLDSPSFRRDLMTCKNFAKLGDGSNSTE
mmetsp:Transcript_87581/g.256068  ORF Transcript_87581/g.256068 Transcript_87581/m.256068 type:complete len:397 (-) Transcript_87581:76-1266(-)